MIKIFTLFLLPILVLLAREVSFPSIANAGEHPPPQFCADMHYFNPAVMDEHCYHPDVLGGWGLKPKRTYKLDYDGDKVCKPIVTALNDALKKDPKKALASVTFPMPSYPELNLDPSQVGPLGSHGTYQSQNPLFSDPMFLRWNPLGGIAPKGAVFDAADWTARWLIVDLENNGHRYLVSNGGAVWNVPEGELDKHDWTLPLNWSGYKMLLTPWPDAPPEATGTNPIDRWKSLNWSIQGKRRTDNNVLPKMPKFPDSHSESGRYPGSWLPFQRVLASTEFVKIDGRIYTILYDPLNDLMIVDDLSQKLGNDLCYIESNINRKMIYP